MRMDWLQYGVKMPLRPKRKRKCSCKWFKDKLRRFWRRFSNQHAPSITNRDKIRAKLIPFRVYDRNKWISVDKILPLIPQIYYCSIMDKQGNVFHKVTFIQGMFADLNLLMGKEEGRSFAIKDVVSWRYMRKKNLIGWQFNLLW